MAACFVFVVNDEVSTVPQAVLLTAVVISMCNLKISGDCFSGVSLPPATKIEHCSVRWKRYHMSANDLLNSAVKHQCNQSSDRVKIIS